MTVSDLSTSFQNYLKAIWALSEWNPDPITTSRLADYIGVRSATVTEAMKKMVLAELVDKLPYGSIKLTSKGRLAALEMIRRHRLIETYLVKSLGYSWDEVHDEAENLEHACSDLMIDRIAAQLGNPERDPHGDPIPSKDGKINIPNAVPLTLQDCGRRVTVERISDADPQVLQYLARLNVSIGDIFQIIKADPLTQTLTARGVHGEITLSTQIIEYIWISGKK
ncbi:metal-dependent transcriptional regulator [Canibacter sp. lx-72]|uniref:metal-dependent transcriptional regulator n=1 Tax=Canibacter zhuwentaonis TaxID=2837491 RepID=UPI001BDC92C5|nr:metal-dependent transcriptional regulator [Canibacter zhuwentaonis]